MRSRRYAFCNKRSPSRRSGLGLSSPLARSRTRGNEFDARLGGLPNCETEFNLACRLCIYLNAGRRERMITRIIGEADQAVANGRCSGRVVLLWSGNKVTEGRANGLGA